MNGRAGLALFVLAGGALAVAASSRRKAALPAPAPAPAPGGAPPPLPSPPGTLLMYPSVRAELIPFLANDEGEGSTNWMYLDVDGNVTIGVGQKLSRLADALALSFVRPDTSAASPGDISAAWTAVTGRKDLAKGGGVAFAKIPGNEIRATKTSLDALVDSELHSFEATLRIDFPNYATAPADAQLGLWRMAWAMGPAFAHAGGWPKFQAAFKRGDWTTAGLESRMNETGQTSAFVHGNDLTQLLFRNAAYVAAHGMPLSALHYPTDLAPLSGGSAGVA